LSTDPDDEEGLEEDDDWETGSNITIGAKRKRPQNDEAGKHHDPSSPRTTLLMYVHAMVGRPTKILRRSSRLNSSTNSSPSSVKGKSKK
jgi:hypothetical protein